MQSFVFSDLMNVMNNESYVAYCYMGKNNRGSLAFFINGSILVINRDSYLPSYSFGDDDYNNFELWSFIHEMTSESDYDVREEAINRLFDVYCGLFNVIPKLQEYQFKIS